MISKTKDVKQSAIASSLSAKIYGLEVIKKNIENESGNLTRFLVMGKNISQPEFQDKTYITSFLFKLKSKPAALYQSLGGFAINGVNLTNYKVIQKKIVSTLIFSYVIWMDISKIQKFRNLLKS